MPARTDRLLLVNAMLGQFITGFAGRSFVVALPTIAGALGSDIPGISWALIAYQLASISLSVVFGRLGDIHGRHAIFGGGFAIMTASSFLCGIAPSAPWLVFFRLVGGIGAAMIASATRVLAMEALPEDSAGKANGFMTTMFRYFTGLADAAPSAQNPAEFVAAMNTTYAVCLALTVFAFVASLMRGGKKVGTPASAT